MAATTSSVPSGRILLDIPCVVCSDHSSGKHYGIFACDGCAGFFKRSIRRNRQYQCKNRGGATEGGCMVDKTHRNQCRACRLCKCVQAGMNKDVQHERGPRHSTIKRQWELLIREHTANGAETGAPPQLTNNLNSTNELSSGSDCQSPPHVNMLAHPSPMLAAHPLQQFMLSMHHQAVLRQQTALNTARAMPPTVRSAPKKRTSFMISAMLAKDVEGEEERSPLTSPSCHSVREQAARVLFMCATWPRTMPQFTSMPMPQQLAILSSQWAYLFALCGVQFNLFSAESTALLRSSCGQDYKETIDALGNLQQRFDALNVDAMEHSCLRAMLLMKHNSIACEQLKMALASYTQLKHPGDPLRCLQMLMVLPLVSQLNVQQLEVIFFRDSIGHACMSRLICDLYKQNNSMMEGGAVNMSLTSSLSPPGSSTSSNHTN